MEPKATIKVASNADFITGVGDEEKSTPELQ
jgi:hypothetical protein